MPRRPRAFGRGAVPDPVPPPLEPKPGRRGFAFYNDPELNGGNPALQACSAEGNGADWGVCSTEATEDMRGGGERKNKANPSEDQPGKVKSGGGHPPAADETAAPGSPTVSTAFAAAAYIAQDFVAPSHSAAVGSEADSPGKSDEPPSSGSSLKLDSPSAFAFPAAGGPTVVGDQDPRDQPPSEPKWKLWPGLATAQLFFGPGTSPESPATAPATAPGSPAGTAAPTGGMAAPWAAATGASPGKEDTAGARGSSGDKPPVTSMPSTPTFTFTPASSLPGSPLAFGSGGLGCGVFSPGDNGKRADNGRRHGRAKRRMGVVAAR